MRYTPTLQCAKSGWPYERKDNPVVTELDLTDTARPCANCQTPLRHPLPNFCGHCGQETSLRAPTVGEFLQQLGGSYISTEGALWRTLWRLLFLPGQLTLEFLAGRRRRFVLPIRLYLTISVLVLLVLKLYTAEQIERNVSSTGQADAAWTVLASTRNFNFLGVGGARAGLKDGVFFCQGMPKSFCARLEKRLLANPATLAEELGQLPSRMYSYVGWALFLLMPCLALWLKLVFWGNQLRFTEHLVFALHLHAFWFAMVPLLLLPWAGFQGAAVIAMVCYPLVALHRVYQRRWWSTALRAALIQLLYLVSLVFAVSGIVMLVMVG